jgi:hypothetical protein
VPDPTEASTDSSNLPECWAAVASPDLNVCSFGPQGATTRLLAIGDSHNNDLLVAYRALAEQNSWRIDVAGHNGCYWTTAVQVKPVRAMVDGCEAWKRNLLRWIDARPPYDAILVTNARNGSPVEAPAGTSVMAATVDGLVRAWATQTARGTRIIAIRDNPAMRGDEATCVVKHRADPNAACSVPEATALGATDALVEATRRSDNARLIDLTDLYCPDGVCLPVIGHVVVYADKDHVTATWALSLVPILSERIGAALAAPA